MTGRVTRETVEGIRKIIRSGKAGVDGRLPTERELAKELWVSRSTLRSALAFLRETGEVETISGHGGGTFVSRSNPDWNLYSMMDASLGSHELFDHPLAMPQGVPQSIRRKGVTSETEVLSAVEIEAPADIAHELGIEQGSAVYEIRRVRSAGGYPVSLECAYLIPEAFAGILEKDLQLSVYSLMLVVYGIKISHITEVLQVVGAAQGDAELLGVSEGSPLFCSETCAYDVEGRQIEFSRDYYRTDRVRFVTENRFSPD